MPYKFQVDSSNTLWVEHDGKYSQRKKSMDKNAFHDQANYVIKLKRGRLLWDLGYTIVLEFGADANNGLCCIVARKLVFEKIKMDIRRRRVT